jgi:hypothetical protein
VSDVVDDDDDDDDDESLSCMWRWLKMMIQVIALIDKRI